MHLAFAITELLPKGGAQRDFIAVVTEMAKRGHQISMITLKTQGDINKDWTLYELGNNQTTHQGRIKALSDYVVSLKKRGLFDAIIGFTKLAGLDAYFAADPCFTANRFKGLNKLLPRYRTYAAIEKALFSNPALKVFFLTEHQRQQYLENFELKQDNQAVLPVSVEEKFHFTQARLESGRVFRQQTQQAENRILLLFVAADFNIKGLDRVIEALSALRFVARSQFELWIVGNGKQANYEPRLQQLTGLNYRFWGGQTELAPFYFASDLLVHPARKEAAGMVLAEAAAARLPMLISDICGYAPLAKQSPLSQIIDEKNCIKALVEALNTYSKQPEALPRTESNPLVSAASRALFCADKIEAWCRP
jgi:UDP-glucose:(heptosyl)LPS alpha-1,3-glucosyltransferase